VRNAWLANKRHDLLAPAAALVELSEWLLRDVRDRGQERFLADVERVHRSGSALLRMVRDVLEPMVQTAGGDGRARRVRHEPRTPLTEIIGLCEIWLEDVV